MADYYLVLGLEKNATTLEIKTAFRKLAKIYHPDKNFNDPNAKGKFESILKAYNILVNPHSRARYDRNNEEPRAVRKSAAASASQKNWTFTDEDLKRRQYYKNHYQSKQHKTVATPSTYSDYKYIMFATPLAVGLLMVIVSMFSSDPNAKSIKKIKPVVDTARPINRSF